MVSVSARHRGPTEVDQPEGTLRSQSTTVGSVHGGHGLGFAYSWEVWGKDSFQGVRTPDQRPCVQLVCLFKDRVCLR